MDAFEKGRTAGLDKQKQLSAQSKIDRDKNMKSYALAKKLQKYIKVKIGRYEYTITCEPESPNYSCHYVRVFPRIQYSQSELLFSTLDIERLYLHTARHGATLHQEQHLEFNEDLDEVLGRFHGVHEKTLKAIKLKEQLYLVGFCVIALLIALTTIF